MKLKKLFAIVVSVSLAIGALSIPELFPSGVAYNATAATVSEDAPKSLADITDTSSFYYQSCPSTGDVKALCFLVDFPDVRNTNSSLTAEAMEEKLNATPSGTSDFNDDPREYVSEFYRTSSYGKLNIDFDVYGWYTFENNRDYCGDVLGSEGMLSEVMTSYDDEIDYSEYDANHDGMLDLVYLLYAGPNDGSGAGFWWNCVTNGFGDEKFDQEMIHKFAFINLSSSQVDYFDYNDSITIIHETGHILGLADYYDLESHNGTLADSHGNTGGFDIMDFMEIGDHNIFSKMMLGWVEPVFITQDTTFDMSCVSDETAKAYIIAPEFKNGVFSEYFVVEFYKNIDNNKYSVICPNGAVRIYHVDASYDLELNNFKYDNSQAEHPLINLVESDGEYDDLKYNHPSYYKDYYTAGMTFGINTAPSTEFYEGEFTGINITVNSIDGDSANVSVTFNNADNEAPEMTKYVMPNAFGKVTNISGTQIFFSSHIFEGDNFGKISYAPAASPEEKVYPESFIMKHPQSVDYSFNSIFITELSELKDNIDYILTIPAGAVVDSSGNPNDETVIKFTSCGGTSDYVEVEHHDEYPDDLDKIASGAPDGGIMESSFESFPLKNGNTLYLHDIVRDFGDFNKLCGYDLKLYTPDNELLGHLYLSNEGKGTGRYVFELDNDTILFATEDNLYCIINSDGTLKEQGTYCDYETEISNTSEFVIFENSIDFIDGIQEEYKYYICRFNFDGTIERFGPIPLPSDFSEPPVYIMAELLYKYNSDYTEYDPNKQIVSDSILDTKDFYYSKFEEYFANSYGISRFHNLNLKKGKTADYNVTSFYDSYIGYISSVHDVEILCSKIGKNGLPLIDVNGGYIGTYFGVDSILLDDDGLLLTYFINSFHGNGSWQTIDGYYIVRLNKDLEVMWDCYAPFHPNEAFCDNGKVYVFSDDGIFAFDDSATEPIFKKDDVNFTDAFKVDTKNQKINGSGKTAEQIKAQLVEGNADITLYDLYGRDISDSEVVDEAVIEIDLRDSAYTYYYHYSSAEQHTISGIVTTGTDSSVDVMVELLDSNGDLVQTAQLTDAGYEFTGVEAGNYTVVVSAPKYCAREYSVEVGEEDVELDVEIHLYGDTNYDGIINSKDATQILLYSSQLSSVFSLDNETDKEYRIKVSDVDKSGIIVSKDATQILRYASNLTSVLDTL